MGWIMMDWDAISPPSTNWWSKVAALADADFNKAGLDKEQGTY
jgi:hypothetical protein